MKLVYDINQKPPMKKNLVYALQQLLAIMAATLLVPVLVNINSGTTYMSQPAALCGAGFGPAALCRPFVYGVAADAALFGNFLLAHSAKKECACERLLFLCVCCHKSEVFTAANFCGTPRKWGGGGVFANFDKAARHLRQNIRDFF